jgi:hypothetical protein
VSFEGVEVARAGGYGVWLDRGSRHVSVVVSRARRGAGRQGLTGAQGAHIHDVGAGGVRIGVPVGGVVDEQDARCGGDGSADGDALSADLATRAASLSR